MKKTKILLSLLLTSLLLAGCGEQGPKGEKGDQGEQGIQGEVGPAGQNGHDGVDGKDGTNGKDGADGHDGVDGKDGNTIIYGSSNPTSIQGKNGDVYLNNATYDLFYKSNNEWNKIGNIKGNNGSNGKDGNDGFNVLSGSSDPELLLGKNGDSFINTVSYDLFIKENDQWTKVGNIKGSNGKDGSNGISVVKTEIDENGDLIVTFSNGDVSNAGHVKDTATYTVKFYCGDDLIETREVEANSKISKPTDEKTIGYEIESWHVRGYTEKEWAFEGYYADRVTENVELDAVYTANQYEITFVDEKFRKTLDPLTVYYNQAYQIPETENVDGYTLTSWMNGDVAFEWAGAFRETSNLLLKAHWDANGYTVSLNPNNGVCDIDTIKVVFDTTYELPIPTRTNYVFLGWFDEDSGDRFSTNATWKTSKDIELTAHWTNITNTYVLDAGDGKCDVSTIVIGWEDPYNLPIPTTDKKDLDWEWIFDCWLLDGEPISSSGDSWTYSNVGKTLVARYKIRDDEEYYLTKYSFKWSRNMGGYDISGFAAVLPAEINYEYAIIPETYDGWPVYAVYREDGTYFNPNTTLKKVFLSSNICTIGQYAFFNCNELTDINMIDTIDYIGKYAFCFCESLEEINLPDNIENICQSTFHSCKKLKKVKLPNNCYNIGKWAFSSCESLEEIIIPQSVLHIESLAFSSTSLKIVELPSEIIKIEYGAFSIKSLEKIYIPYAEVIEEEAFFVLGGANTYTVYCGQLSQPDEWENNWCNTNDIVWGYNA